MNETLKLCLALRDAGYQPEAKADPEAWNAKYEVLDTDEQALVDEKNKGWRWEKHPVEGWYPNPGRLALADEIEKLIGKELFAERYGTAQQAKSLGHEALMQKWLDEKQNHD